jgi:hypothetical protein
MTVCNWILSPVIVIVRRLIRTVREVVRTVCEWVSTIIRTIIEVVEKVCTWLPWPLNKLCEWVTKVIEVVETVWDWVCEEVIDRIIRWVEVVLEYVYYVLKWVCWIIDWVFRLPELIFCLLGVEPKKYLRVCVKILTDSKGNPAIAPEDVNSIMQDTARIFTQCKLELIVESVELVEKEEFLDGTSCEFSGMFSDFFLWFSEQAEAGCVTVYFVNSIVDASGCAYPGTDWVTIASSGRGCTVAQEIGHLADLWKHSDTPGNIMTNPCGDDVTRFQCCMIRTSRFASIVPALSVVRLSSPDKVPVTVRADRILADDPN